MKKVFKISFVIIYGLLIGCERGQEITTLHKQPEMPYVSLQDAKSIAGEFLRKSPDNGGRNFRKSAKMVGEAVTVNDSSNTPAFYIFNYENDEGFMLVSAEKKIQPILAFSDKGSFSLESANPGLKGWILGLKKTIQHVRKDKNARLKPGVDVAWKEYEGKRDVATNGLPEDPPPCPGYQVATAPNILSTQWGQGAGYNHECPTASGGQCNRAVTGCVATAMAQVMRFHQQSSQSYNWASMPSSISPSDVIYNRSCNISSGENEVARLMRQCGDAVFMNWGATSSSAYGTDIERAFQSWLGYSTATDRINFDPYTILNEINMNSPVIIDGDGHVWVASGWQQVTIDCTYGYFYLWMNWGWDGDQDGFFSAYDWTPYNYDFNGQRAMIIVRK